MGCGVLGCVCLVKEEGLVRGVLVEFVDIVILVEGRIGAGDGSGEGLGSISWEVGEGRFLG